MYHFIRNNFQNSTVFLTSALKTGELTYYNSSKKVLSMMGISEILGIDKSRFNVSSTENLFITDFIPQDYLELKRNKVESFLALSKGNFQKYLIISYVLGKRSTGYFNHPNLLVNAKIKREQDLVKVRFCNLEAAGPMNDRIMLFQNIQGNGNMNIEFAMLMSKANGISLINKEYEILCLLAKGYDSEKISKLLSISKHTVSGYRKSLLNKFKAQTTLQLIYNAFKEGYI